MALVIGGVVDQCCDGPVGVASLGDGFSQIIGVGDVALEEKGGAPVFFCHLGDEIRGVRAADKRDAGALGEEPISQHGTDARAAAGDVDGGVSQIVKRGGVHGQAHFLGCGVGI